MSRYAWGGFAVDSDRPISRLRPHVAQDPPLRAAGQDPAPTVRVVWREDELRPPPGSIVGEMRLSRRPAVFRMGRSPEGFFVAVDDAGAFFVHASRDLIEASPLDGAAAWAEHYLVNSVLSIFAASRGVVCLHASAVAMDGRACVFAGASGAGKTTAALRLVDDGWRFLSDDATVIRFRDDATPVVYPGATTARHDALDGERDAGGKVEVTLDAASGPAELERVDLLLVDRPEPSRAQMPQALCELQPGWSFVGAATRRVLFEQTCAIAPLTVVEIRAAATSRPAGRLPESR